jgi:hypothetical protein
VCTRPPGFRFIAALSAGTKIPSSVLCEFRQTGRLIDSLKTFEFELHIADFIAFTLKQAQSLNF